MSGSVPYRLFQVSPQSAHSAHYGGILHHTAHSRSARPHGQMVYALNHGLMQWLRPNPHSDAVLSLWCGHSATLLTYGSDAFCNGLPSGLRIPVSCVLGVEKTYSAKSGLCPFEKQDGYHTAVLRGLALLN